MLRRACPPSLLPHLVVVGDGPKAHCGPCDQGVGSPRSGFQSFPGPVLLLTLSCRCSGHSHSKLLSHGLCQDMYYSELAKYLL